MYPSEIGRAIRVTGKYLVNILSIEPYLITIWIVGLLVALEQRKKWLTTRVFAAGCQKQLSPLPSSTHFT